MNALEIHLFGNVRVNYGESTPELKMTHVSQGLFAYLVLHRHQTLSRDTLADLFWGESSEDKARSSLSTALWRLRRTLEPGNIAKGTYLITTSEGDVGFNCQSDYWLDIESFESKVEKALGQSTQDLDGSQARELESALQFYERELMEGFYEDWVLRERERIRMLYMTGLLKLTAYYRMNGDFERGIHHAQQILKNDPLREEVHRYIMELYLDSGQRALAVRQYEICESVLHEEMSIRPMDETRALYSQILSGASSSDSSLELDTFKQAVNKLELAAQKLDEVKRHLKQVMRMIKPPL